MKCADSSERQAVNQRQRDVCAFGMEALGHARHSGPPGVGGSVTTSRYRPVPCVTVRGRREAGRWGTIVGRVQMMVSINRLKLVA